MTNKNDNSNKKKNRCRQFFFCFSTFINRMVSRSMKRKKKKKLNILIISGSTIIDFVFFCKIFSLKKNHFKYQIFENMDRVHVCVCVLVFFIVNKIFFYEKKKLSLKIAMNKTLKTFLKIE